MPACPISWRAYSRASRHAGVDRAAKGMKHTPTLRTAGKARQGARTAAHSRPLPPTATPAPIATLPEWVGRMLPLAEVIPPHAITAEMYARASGASYGHASSIMRRQLAAGKLTAGRRGKALFYWPAK